YCKRNPLKLIVSRDGNRIIYSNAEGIHYINLSEEKTKSDQGTIIPDIQIAKESKTTIFGFDFSKFFPLFLPRQKPSPQQQNIPNNEKPKENPLHNHIQMSHYETGGIAISEDGNYAYWAFYDKLYEWNLETSTVSREIELGKPGHLVEKFRFSKNRISVSRDLAIALLGFGDGTIYAIDLLSGNVIWNKQAHDNSVNALAMISDRQLVVSMSNDQTIKIWNLLNGELLTVFTSDTKIKDLVVDPDNCVIIVSADNPPRVLNLLFRDEKFL
ncbi:MAG TPA: hypothetical protein PLL95_13875, partial [Anaerolineales bacterium]|nr:hypothetical protein [Anaerolineales bacterium]